MKLGGAGSSNGASGSDAVNRAGEAKDKSAIITCKNSKVNTRINNKHRVVQFVKDLWGHLDQFHHTQQCPTNEDDSTAWPSVFNWLSFIQPTLRSVVTIPKGSQYYSKKFQRKREVTHATINMVGHDDPILRVSSSNSSPKSQFSNENYGVYCFTRSRTRLARANHSNSPLHHELQEEKDDTDQHSAYASKISDSCY